MEKVDAANQRLMPLQKAFAPLAIEAYGTFLLVLVWCCSSSFAGSQAPFAIAAVLVSQIFTGGHLSGAHYNPAVTVGVFLSGRNKISPLMAVGYIIVQVTAGCIAAFISWGMMFEQVPLWCSAGADGYSWLQQLLAETMVTFALVFTVANVATTKSQDGNGFFAIAIASVILFAAITFGPITCGFYNPAVGTGPLIVKALYSGDANDLTLIWVAWVGPVLGAIGAAMFFRLTNPREYGPESNSEEMPIATQWE